MKTVARKAYKAGTGDDLLAESTQVSGVRSAFDSKTASLLVTILALICGVAVAWLWSRPVGVEAVPPPVATQVPTPVPETAPSPKPTGTVEPTGTVIVYVSGAVADPGLVELEVGSRVADAVKERGGWTPEADLGGLNMARVVSDGEHIIVPKPGEEVSEPSEVAEAPVDTKVNINEASASQLETLNGIGPALAERIIAYRDEKGPFTSIDQLLDVSGIGQATLEKFAADLAL